MRYRVLIVGIDVDLLEIRQVLLNSWGYDSLIATPEEVDEKLLSGRFDLVILSLMLSQEEKRQHSDQTSGRHPHAGAEDTSLARGVAPHGGRGAQMSEPRSRTFISRRRS